MFNSKYIYDLSKLNNKKNYYITFDNTIKNRIKAKIIIDNLRGMGFLGRGIWRTTEKEIGIWIYSKKFLYAKDSAKTANMNMMNNVFTLDFFKPNIESANFKFVIIEKTINRTSQARWYK